MKARNSRKRQAKISATVTKQKIIDATLAIAAKKGFEQATTAEIAGKAGVAEGSIYTYFRTKDDLLIYTVSQFAQSFFSSLSQAIEQEKSPLAKLDRLISFHIHFFTRKGNVFQIIYGKRPGAKVQMARILQVTVAPYSSLIEKVLTEGIDKGYFEPLNPEIAASSLLGGMQLTLLRRFFDFANYSPEEAIEDIRKIYVQGILKQK